MHLLLTKLLQKRGIKHVNDLPSEPMPDGSPSDKQTFENWNRILSAKQEVTVENIAQFCESQVREIEGQWKQDQTKSYLIAQHTVYKAILEATKAPQKEREALEKYLQSLLNTS